MSYGIEVKNKYGSVIINETSQTYLSNATAYSTASPGSVYPPAGVSLTSDYLVFGAPAVNQNKIVGFDPASTTTIYWDFSSEAPTSYRWISFKKSDLFSPGSGYGLQVFDSASDLCYDSTENTGFRILQIFRMGSAVSRLTFPTQTTTYSNFQNVFVLLNTLPISGNAYLNTYKATYEWVTSTTGRISLYSGNLFSSPGMIIEVLK